MMKFFSGSFSRPFSSINSYRRVGGNSGFPEPPPYFENVLQGQPSPQSPSPAYFENISQDPPPYFENILQDPPPYSANSHLDSNLSLQAPFSERDVEESPILYPFDSEKNIGKNIKTMAAALDAKFKQNSMPEENLRLSFLCLLRDLKRDVRDNKTNFSWRRFESSLTQDQKDFLVFLMKQKPKDDVFPKHIKELLKFLNYEPEMIKLAQSHK